VEALRQMMEDNAALFHFWSEMKKKKINKTTGLS
jgi:hypothetical protein